MNLIYITSRNVSIYTSVCIYRERANGRERKRKSVCVCVYLCVCIWLRERERERERNNVTKRNKFTYGDRYLRDEIFISGKTPIYIYIYIYQIISYQL